MEDFKFYEVGGKIRATQEIYSAKDDKLLYSNAD